MSDIQKRGFNPLAVRYFFLQAHYRSPVNFTWEGLEAAGNGLKKLYEKVQSAKCKVQNYSSKLKVDTENKYYINFHEAINDDLNTAKGLSVLWELLKDESISNNQKTVLILKFDKVLGLKLTDVKPNKTEELPEEIKKLADERQTARELKDYKLSDKLRREIEKKGYEVQDTTEGQIIKFCD
jgi:cysteinyl-tRNA synthetase